MTAPAVQRADPHDVAVGLCHDAVLYIRQAPFLYEPSRRRLLGRPVPARRAPDRPAPDPARVADLIHNAFQHLYSDAAQCPIYGKPPGEEALIAITLLLPLADCASAEEEARQLVAWVDRALRQHNWTVDELRALAAPFDHRVNR
jgi:hypothetical protein